MKRFLFAIVLLFSFWCTKLFSSEENLLRPCPLVTVHPNKAEFIAFKIKEVRFISFEKNFKQLIKRKKKRKKRGIVSFLFCVFRKTEKTINYPESKVELFANFFTYSSSYLRIDKRGPPQL